MYTESILVNPDPTRSLAVIENTLKEPNVNECKLNILSPTLRNEEVRIPDGTVIPPDLPKMFLDLLIPVKGLKNKKLPHECSLCGEEFATYNSLVTHNKSHREPACLVCGAVVASASKLALHTAQCQKNEPIVVTSKYGRSRPVKSYLANLK